MRLLSLNAQHLCMLNQHQFILHHSVTQVGTRPAHHLVVPVGTVMTPALVSLAQVGLVTAVATAVIAGVAAVATVALVGQIPVVQIVPVQTGKF